MGNGVVLGKQVPGEDLTAGLRDQQRLLELRGPKAMHKKI